ncbi:MAG: beta-propeller domain-containing protein [Candidatus Hydrogenedens sp.]
MKQFIAKIIIGLPLILLIIVSFSCPKNPSDIPSESGNTQYIEGNLDEGETEGIFEGEVKFTSAGVLNNRNWEYTPTTTTDVSEGNEGGENTRELVEPDVYRRLNNILFVLNQYRGLTLVDLDNKSVISNVPIYGYPRDLYVVDNRAYVLIGYTVRHTIEDGIIKKTTGSQLYIVDIGNPEVPKIISALTLPGDFIDSRMLGDVLYAVTSDYQYSYIEDATEGGNISSSATWTKEAGSKCWITSVNIKQEENPSITDQVEFPGYGTVIQASTSSIYVCASDWNNNSTQLTYIDITNPSGKIESYSLGTVPGYVADRFKLDEWDETLRVVSNTWWSERHTYLTIFDVSNPSQGFPQLSQITIPDAQGETLYATRFAGPLAYLVTYLTIDPLFVLDLTDPSKPEVKGQLKVPGWSVHIEPIANNQLIALGIDDTENQRRVKVSWFDVSAPNNPEEKSVVSLGEGWTWSSAFSDVKSFAILGNLVIVPFSGWNGNEYKEQLQFIVLNMENQQLMSLGSVDMKGQVSRTIKYNDLFYAITSEYIHEIQCDGVNPPDLTNNSILLAENVADVMELSASGVVMEIINQTEQKNIGIRLTEGNTIFSSISIETNGWLMDTIKVSNNAVALVINEWSQEHSYESYYRVVFVTIDENFMPSIFKDIKLPLAPYYSYWGWCRGCDYMPVPMPERLTNNIGSVALSEGISSDSQKVIAPYYWWYPITNTKPSMVCGNYLVLRGWGNSYEYIIGNQTTPYDGFAILNLDNPEDIRTVGLGYNNIVSLLEASGKLFLTLQKNVSSENDYYPLVAYYLGEIDLISLEEPDFANIPGILQSSNEQGNILFLKDWQYSSTGNYYDFEQWIHSIQWEKNKPVKIIDSYKLPTTWGNVRINLPYLLVLTGYDNLVLEKIDITTDGRFVSPCKTKIGNVWGDILGMTTNHLYLSLDGASVLLMNLGYGENPVMNNIYPIPNYPQKFRVGKLGIYIVSGYSGYIFLPFQIL